MNRQFLQDLANEIGRKLPDNYGFILLAAPFSAPDGAQGGDGRLIYTSNIQREAAIAMLKEWLIKCGASEDWMQHIK